MGRSGDGEGAGVAAYYEQLGAAAWLCGQSPGTRKFSVHALTAFVSPAIHLGQLRILWTHKGWPVAMITWAHLSPEGEERLLREPGRILEVAEWNEGERTHLRFVLALDHVFPQVVEYVRNGMFRRATYLAFTARRRAAIMGGVRR